MATPYDIEQRLTMIYDDVKYLRNQVDALKDQLNKVIWRVVGLGVGGGAVGFVVALLTNNVLN